MSERKTTAILVKLSETEKQLIEEGAQAENLPAATWIRALAIKAAKAAKRNNTMTKAILIAAVLSAVACGGPEMDPMATDDAPAPVAAPSVQVTAPPPGSVHWTFTSFTDAAHTHADVQGSFDVAKAPAGTECSTLHPDGTATPCADLVNLSGTATVGTESGTATGTEAPSNGIFRVYLDVGGRRLVIIATENGTSFSGYLAGPAGNEQVVGTSP